MVHALLLCACGDPLLLGSDVVWSTDHETSDLADWSLDSRGGANAGAEADSAIEVTSERAHSGTYSVKLTRPAVNRDVGPLLFRELFPSKAYYSAWYNLPSAPQTVSYWTIAQIRAVPADDSDGAPHGINVNLRVLPGGQVVLVVFDNDEARLQAPLSEPAPFVPVDAWFHLEVEYENSGALPGHLRVWLDGIRIYDLATGVLVDGSVGYFMPCNVAKQLEPSPAVVYVDDVAISLTRVGPDGLLTIE